jgi:phage terminase small subunit
MTDKQEKYKANRIMGMSPENAAVSAGYSAKYARKKAYRIERVVKVGIMDELERAGLTAKVQAQALFKLAFAKKSQVCDLYIQKDENGKYKINENMSEFIEVDDNKIQLETWKHIADLKGMIVSKPLIDQSKHYHFKEEIIERFKRSARVGLFAD